MTAESLLAAKKGLRRSVLEQRRSLSPAEIRQRSEQILQTLLLLQTFKQAKTIMCYAAVADEVQTKEIMACACRLGKKICIPYIRDKAGIMDAVYVKESEALVAGAYGIFTVETTKAEIVSPEQIDLVLVPGAAFDRAGHRLGLGGGFYDRFLAQTQNAFCLALAFFCQIKELVPYEPHDHLMDAVLTEQGLLDCRGNR
jgi:5,10-methenyltetrahydrofolate synthetase